MKVLPFFVLAAMLLTASCKKSDTPEPCRTNTSCESEFRNSPDPSGFKAKPTTKHPVQE